MMRHAAARLTTIVTYRQMAPTGHAHTAESYDAAGAGIRCSSTVWHSRLVGLTSTLTVSVQAKEPGGNRSKGYLLY